MILRGRPRENQREAEPNPDSAELLKRGDNGTSAFLREKINGVVGAMFSQVFWFLYQKPPATSLDLKGNSVRHWVSKTKNSACSWEL